MSKIICAFFRSGPPTNLSEKLKSVCKKIEPDNIIANDSIVLKGENSATAIMNPMNTLSIHDNSVLMGNVITHEDCEPWYKIQNKSPEGAYALFRSDSNTAEFITDAVASRTIWYYSDEEKVLASTSQRAIVLFLESFEFDTRCIPWMLSTGSLGPEFSWDKRIKRVPVDTRIILDKSKWEIKIVQNQVVFKKESKSKSEHKRALNDAMSYTFNKIQMDVNKWVLPLSGGYDSRGILYFLLKFKEVSSQEIRTITWGLNESQFVKGNDAYVAKVISEKLNLPHKYYHTDLSDESVETILNRFIQNGDGRIDHISGYLDGFKIWKTLFEDGVEGTIRGDEGFGWANVSTAINVRYYNGCGLCSDFANLKALCEEHNIDMQEMPSFLEQRTDETLSTWRDRIYHEYRLPSIISALSDLKLCYVEQSTPLLSSNIIGAVRKLPDELRTEKYLFRRLVDALKPKIEFATKDANASASAILKHPGIVRMFEEELNSNDAKAIFPSKFLEHIIRNMTFETTPPKKNGAKKKFLAYLKQSTPKFLKNMILSHKPLNIDSNLLAFRIYIIIYMNKLLKQQALN